MNEAKQQEIIAIRDIKRLENIHNNFADRINNANFEQAFNVIVEGGQVLNVTATSISYVCLGYEIVATHRPVVVDGYIRALEYNFTVQWMYQPVSVFRFYLQLNGVLTYDPKGVNKFQDINNLHIEKHIEASLTTALLASRLYAPTDE